MDKKYIAWGANNTLWLYLSRTKKIPFDYCVDSFSNEKKIMGLPVLKPHYLENEDKNSVVVILFTISNNSLREISSILRKMGFQYRINYFFFSDFYYDSFSEKFFKNMGWYPDINIYKYALSYYLNSVKPIHTTILGTVTFLLCMDRIKDLDGDIAEVGAFEGGNILCALNFASSNRFRERKFYIFESFEGFPELSDYDPKEKVKRGDYRTNTSFLQIQDDFGMFPEAKIIKGFVPETFRAVPEGSKFSIVFYDCDLYQPALDTFDFFWDKIVDGGYLIVHDYEYQKGGYEGVKKATDEFFSEKNVVISSYFESTMAIIKKE